MKGITFVMAGIVWRGRETHNHQQGPVRWKQHPVDCSLFVLVGRLWLRDYPLPTLGELMRAYLLKQRFAPHPADSRTRHGWRQGESCRPRSQVLPRWTAFWTGPSS